MGGYATRLDGDGLVGGAGYESVWLGGQDGYVRHVVQMVAQSVKLERKKKNKLLDKTMLLTSSDR